MDKACNIILMEINIKAILLMVFQRDSDHIIGRIALIIEVILSKDLEMVMEYGMVLKKKNFIKVITC